MKKIMVVVGTRPEAIKLAPVLRELSRHSGEIAPLVCSTGQHREMLDQVFRLFKLVPDFDLRVMQPNQGLSQLTANLFVALDRVIHQERPDWVLTQGDTTTAFVASMVAFYHRVHVAHVEAGLRTGDKYQPFPEEANRRIADLLSDLYFAPTGRSVESLLREGCPPESVICTGNTVVDAVLEVASWDYQWHAGPLRDVPDQRLVLITAHRRESFGQPFQELCLAIRDLATRYRADGLHFVYPVHLNPNVREPVQAILRNLTNVTLLDPLDYVSLIHLMKRAVLVLTDSGGIQEEAPAFHVPVLVMRDKTERPEGVDAGVAVLVGTDRHRIVDAAIRVIENPEVRRSMTTLRNPYGDGLASARIVAALRGAPIPPFNG